MRLSTEATVTIPRPRGEVFEALTEDAALPRFCQKKGPFAAIADARTHGPIREGARRTVTLSDGMVLEETITAFVAPSRHAYEWSDPPLPLGALVKKAEGTWLFEERGGDTFVTWRYEMTFRSRLLWPLAKGLLAGFGGWMQAALDRAAREL